MVFLSNFEEVTNLGEYCTFHRGTILDNCALRSCGYNGCSIKRLISLNTKKTKRVREIEMKLPDLDYSHFLQTCNWFYKFLNLASS